MPVFLSVAVLFVVSLLNMGARIENDPTWQVLISLLGASLGGGISILINTKALNFEEFKSKKHYFLLGTERILLAYMAGAVAYIALRSGFLSPGLPTKGYWALMLVIVISGFSESLIPGFLSKSENIVHNKALQRTSR
ncbi:hypothetical protein [Laribacter hongkongensis]|uniref:hypothetical protein n=1 Tax=Laribacter hongkongensis TaxID=168471 RepID=UPI0011C70381|nr:hypothetical protein [Laribacter hongkongensis]MCG9040564.1 hypothetical protein [Laribacter hongkongensis]MCG9067154.1 hypothetical protein [Laribacter hongkongensis]MCG9087968.1 hypothetical protein [Laribacter hongkongensis]MCG9110497.1 hypothetical protein [Laribacter hongkongensis]MCG9121413.1 hypothetical protein [Laribacter hongkongensis]